MSRKCKKNKRMRCIYCNKLFNLNDDNSYEVDGIDMYYCLYCGEEQSDYKVKYK